MTELVVAATDLALALQCGAFAWLLRGSSGPQRGPAVAFFAALAVSSAAGAAVHGGLDGSPLGAGLWQLTLLALGAAALASWRLGAVLALPPAARGPVSALAGLAFAVQAAVVLFANQDFRVAVVHYVPAALFLFGCLAWAARRRRSRPLALAAAGMGLTLAAAPLQQLKVGFPSLYFDHNALYHVIEMAALSLVFAGLRGAARRNA